MAAGQNVPAGDRPPSAKSGRIVYSVNMEAHNSEATFYVPLMYAPCAGAVKSVVIIPRAAITGADTNTRKFTVINGGTDGTGTDVIGTALSLTSGNDMDAKTPYTLYDYDEDEVASDDEDTLDAGEVLLFKNEEVGIGQSISASTIIVEFEARG